MQTLTEEEFKKKYGVIGINQFPDVEKEQSLFDALKSDLAERGQQNTELLNDSSESPLVRGFEVGANTAGGVGNAIGETLTRTPIIGGALKSVGGAIKSGFEAVTSKLGGTKFFQEAAGGLEEGNPLEKGLKIGQAGGEVAGNVLAGNVGVGAAKQGTKSIVQGAGKAMEAMPKPDLGAAGKYVKGAVRDVIPTRQALIDTNLAKALDLTPGDMRNIKASSGNEVGTWLSENNLIGTNKVTTQGLIGGFFKTNYDMVRSEIAKVKDLYDPLSIPRYKETLEALAVETQGKLGLEMSTREITSLLKKEKITLNDVQRTKELVDDYYSLYNKMGDVQQGIQKQGIANVREELKQFIEREVMTKTGADIRKLNNNVSTAKGIKDAIEARSTRGLTRANITWRDAMVGLGVYAFASPIVGLAAVLAYKLATSPTARLRFARWLDQRTDAQKASINEAFRKGEVPDEVKKIMELENPNSALTQSQ